MCNKEAEIVKQKASKMIKWYQLWLSKGRVDPGQFPRAADLWSQIGAISFENKIKQFEIVSIRTVLL